MHMDDRNGYFASVRTAPSGVVRDHCHLPLKILSKEYPEEFRLLRQYDCYAIVRDPMERFSSAISEHCKQYKRIEFDLMPAREKIQLSKDICDRLGSEDIVSSADLCHFVRQMDFIRIDGEVIVKNLFPLERLALLRNAIASRTNDFSLTFPRQNQRKEFRGVLSRQAASIGRKCDFLVPGSVRPLIRRWARRVFLRPSLKSSASWLDDDVAQFVQSFYEEDIRLWQTVLAGTRE